MSSKEFAYWFVWGSALLTLGSIAFLAHTSKGGLKPVHMLAMLAVLGGVATLYKELGSSTKTDAIKATGENTNQRVIDLMAQNSALQGKADNLSHENAELKDKADSLLHESRDQSNQLLDQGRLLVDHRALLINQDKMLADLQQENINKSASEEALKRETLEIDKQRLRSSIYISYGLIVRTRTSPLKSRTLQENKDWTSQALSLFESEKANSYLKQDSVAFKLWNDATTRLRSQSSFLLDPKFMRTRDLPHDAETSKKLLNQYLQETQDKVAEVTRYIQIP